MPSYYYTKFQKNPCVGRNERCPLSISNPKPDISPAEFGNIFGEPGFEVHTKCFDIFRKLRPSTFRIWLMTPCHSWAFREIQDGVQEGCQITKKNDNFYIKQML